MCEVVCLLYPCVVSAVPFAVAASAASCFATPIQHRDHTFLSANIRDRWFVVVYYTHFINLWESLYMLVNP